MIADDVELPGRTTLSDSLTTGILELIEDLSVGSRLPAVPELARRFSVTAPTIREALRRLQATHTVELRHGSGVYVGPNVHRVVLPNPHMTRPTLERVRQLVHARAALEPGIAECAARDRIDSDVTHLREVLDNATANFTDGAPLRWHFHREIARVTGNPLLYEVIDTLLVANSREQKRVRVIYPDRARDLDHHRALVDAIAERDPAAARELMVRHLGEIITAVEQQVQTTKSEVTEQ